MLCNLNEGELVKNILLGTNFQARSRVTLLCTPHTFVELEKMYIYAHNVEYIDRERNARRGSHHQQKGRGNVNNIYRYKSSNLSPDGVEPVGACFCCGKLGHKIRDCCQNQSSRGREHLRGRGRSDYPKNV